MIGINLVRAMCTAVFKMDAVMPRQIITGNRIISMRIAMIRRRQTITAYNNWDIVEKQLRGYIIDTMQKNNINVFEVDDETELVNDRIINSLLLITLISGIEDILDLRVVNDDVGIEDFSTINKIINSAHKAYMSARKCEIV